MVTNKFWENFELALCVSACAAVATTLTWAGLVVVAVWLRFQGGF